MECWYAAACMVAYYRRPGPRLGLPAKWQANRGIGPTDFVALAKAEGLSVVPIPPGPLKEVQLGMFLRNYGPIWCAGQWDGVKHIVVLTGVDGDKVFINDPNPAKGARQETVSWFNTKLDRKVAGCMMYMPA